MKKEIKDCFTESTDIINIEDLIDNIEIDLDFSHLKGIEDFFTESTDTTTIDDDIKDIENMLKEWEKYLGKDFIEDIENHLYEATFTIYSIKNYLETDIKYYLQDEGLINGSEK